MAHIILKTWYQEKPNEIDIEPLLIDFDSLEDAVKYLNENIDDLLDTYPVTEIVIK